MILNFRSEGKRNWTSSEISIQAKSCRVQYNVFSTWNPNLFWIKESRELLNVRRGTYMYTKAAEDYVIKWLIHCISHRYADTLWMEIRLSFKDRITQNNSRPLQLLHIFFTFQAVFLMFKMERQNNLVTFTRLQEHLEKNRNTIFCLRSPFINIAP